MGSLNPQTRRRRRSPDATTDRGVPCLGRGARFLGAQQQNDRRDRDQENAQHQEAIIVDHDERLLLDQARQLRDHPQPRRRRIDAALETMFLQQNISSVHEASSKLFETSCKPNPE